MSYSLKRVSYLKKYNRLKELTVLYVENDKEITKHTVDILQLKVKKVLTASNGQEAITIYKKEKIDIIITDIQMPVMNGLTMVKKIRELNDEIPVIITSAFNETSFLKQAIDLHVDKYIIKPIDMSQLFAVLNRASEVIFQKKELQLKDIMLKNREKIYAMGELIENIAHQWRQPLSVISTAASGILLQKECGDLTDDFLVEACTYINNNAQKLSNTIEQFRELFHKDEVEVEFNLKDIIFECTDILKEFYERKNIYFILDIDDFIVTGIKNNYVQILLIILSNAKDVLIENNKNIEPKYIFIELKKNILLITDNAGGIKEKDISKIFEPYFTTKHKSHGTGLGLYIVHKLITEYLEATIQVQNVEYEYNNLLCKGVEFKITF